MRKKIVLALAWVLLSCISYAQDSLQSKTLQEVVVTGTRYEVPIEKSGKSITKISSATLDQFSGQNMAAVLNFVPNVQIDGANGAPGTNLGYYVRGSRNRQSVILVDGVPMTDPSGISPEFDLRLLALDQVDNIEVMRGGLSSLYGSGAAASVINISLRQPKANGVHGMLDVNGGSFNTFAQNLSVSGKNNKIYFQLMANNSNSKGFSSALEKDGADNFDKDGLSRQDGLLRIGYAVDKNVDVQIFGALDKFEADYDGGPYVDANNTQTYQQFRGGLKSTIKHTNGKLQITAQRTKLDKEFKSSFPSKYTGYTTFVEAFDKFELSPLVSIIGGASLQRFSYEQPELASRDTTNFTILDPYASFVLDLPSGFNLQAGARLNHHSEYGSNFIYNINPSYLIGITDAFKIKLLTSVSTSYITPSLYQLFSNYGNRDLKPEEAFNLEGGVSAYINNGSISLVYFDRKETDAYGFMSFFDEGGNFTGGKYYNLATERKVHGVEVEAKYSITKSISAAANYSYCTSDNRVSFYRIPKNKFNVSVNAMLWKGGSASLRYQFTGERSDMDYSTFTEVTMDSYQLVDFYLSQQIKKDRIYVYGSVNNILDEQYTWSPGYTSMTRNFTLGAKVKF